LALFHPFPFPSPLLSLPFPGKASPFPFPFPSPDSPLGSPESELTTRESRVATPQTLSREPPAVAAQTLAVADVADTATWPADGAPLAPPRPLAEAPIIFPSFLHILQTLPLPPLPKHQIHLQLQTSIFHLTPSLPHYLTSSHPIIQRRPPVHPSSVLQSVL
jgi:hypothetical protein